MTSAVALTPPTISTTSANRAGSRHPPWRSDRAVERDHPGQRRPRQQDDRDPGRVRQEVRAEHVGQRRDGPSRTPPSQLAEEVADAGAGREEDRAQPEPLGDPVRHPDRLHHPVVGTQREEVAEVLVGDGSQPDVGIPHGPRPREQAARLEVQVGLGVRADPPGRGQQERSVRDGGQDQGRQRAPKPAHPARRWASVARI